MPCCKCKQRNWPDPQPELEGQDDCLFHAPVKPEGMSVEDFNAQVFARIDAVKAKNEASGKDELCRLSGTIFPGDISFGKYGKDNPLPKISFVFATFGGEAEFEGATFGGKALFASAKFRVPANFRDSKFCGGADFVEAEFTGKADFSGAKFSGKTDFAMAKFDGWALFTEATFGGMANFARVKFSGVAGFKEAKFGEMAHFDAATFTGKADFSGAKFSGKTDFAMAKFDGWALFTEATFGGMADFAGVKFSGVAGFMEAKFDDMAYFRAAAFSCNTGFQAATFNRSAHFDAATFSGEASFQTATFCEKAGRAYFQGATFGGEADFGKATFGREANFKGVKAENIALRMHSLISTSLANLSFTSMDTECFSFKGCDWPEKLWPEAQEKPNYKLCEELYRSLKQKAAEEHDQPLVSRWHYREKLMALKKLISDKQALKHFEEIEEDKLSPWRKAWPAAQLLWSAPGLLLSLNFWYWAFSGYGEREKRARAWLVFFCLVPFVLFGFERILETARSGSPDWNFIGTVFDEWSLCVPFVQTGFKGTAKAAELEPWKLRVAWIFQIFIALQASLFAFTLRNHFRR